MYNCVKTKLLTQAAFSCNQIESGTHIHAANEIFLTQERQNEEEDLIR